MRHLLPVCLLAGCAAGLGAEETAGQKEIADLLAARFQPQIASIDVSQSRHDNGTIGGAYIRFKDIETGHPVAACRNVVIERFLRLTRWSEEVVARSPEKERYVNGWYVPADLDRAIVHVVYRRFEIADKTARVKIPDAMSHDQMLAVLTFCAGTVDLGKIHEVVSDKDKGTIRIRTLEQYRGNLDASGDGFEVQLDAGGKPTRVTKIGRWIS
jgi:hypothetical protein